MTPDPDPEKEARRIINAAILLIITTAVAIVAIVVRAADTLGGLL